MVNLICSAPQEIQWECINCHWKLSKVHKFLLEVKKKRASLIKPRKGKTGDFKDLTDLVQVATYFRSRVTFPSSEDTNPLIRIHLVKN